MAQLFAIPALNDNYIWGITADAAAKGAPVALVDPGEAQPAIAWLQAHGHQLAAILITHHHYDHTDGIAALVEYAKTQGQDNIPVYAPKAEAEQIPQANHWLANGDTLKLDWLDLEFKVIAVPGHTLGHIVYYADEILLSGDALFFAGCGRLFEGTPKQMQPALAKLRHLPPQTRVYAGHEYTLANLAFAQQVEPDNAQIPALIKHVTQQRDEHRPSLPSTLEQELAVNPFLRWDAPQVLASANQRAGKSLTDPADIFAEIRAWKDAL